LAASGITERLRVRRTRSPTGRTGMMVSLRQEVSYGQPV
jgi:hypothetical protein